MTLIIRAPRPERGWTDFDNKVLRDPRISFRALGLLVRMLSNADGYRMTAADLWSERGKEGRDAIRAALKELEAAGYLVRQRYRCEGGLWKTQVYVYDTPQPTPQPIETEDGFGGGEHVDKTTQPEPARPARQSNHSHSEGGEYLNSRCMDLLDKIKSKMKKSRHGALQALISSLKRRDGNKLTSWEYERLLTHIHEKADDPIAYLKGIIKKGGWDSREIEELALPGESLRDVKTRLLQNLESKNNNPNGKNQNQEVKEVNNAVADADVSDDDILEFVKTHPQEFEDWLEKQRDIVSIYLFKQQGLSRLGLKQVARRFYYFYLKTPQSCAAHAPAT